jgi:cysteine synthase
MLKFNAASVHFGRQSFNFTVSIISAHTFFTALLCSQIVEDMPEVDAVVVPIGGAGLIAGVACAVKTLKPECQV